MMTSECYAGERDAEPQWLQTVRAYHERSKHRFGAYARGPETLDWDAQPNPFRVYTEAETQPLTLAAVPDSVTYAAVLAGTATVRSFSLRALAQLLRLAFGITAWKQIPNGPSWALRANPSSGNLHPTEVWVIARGWPELVDGLYHYDAREHALQRRCAWSRNAEECTEPELYVALSTIYWREAWKYGERAFRYCHLDIGHAVSALGFAGAALGWRADLESGGTAELDTLLGLTRTEHKSVEQESAACLFRIQTNDTKASTPANNWQQLLQRAQTGHWQGRPNRIDPQPHYQWPVIAEMATATRASSPSRVAAAVLPSGPEYSRATANSIAVEQLISRRRSAQAYDARAALSRDEFVDMLQALCETRWQPLLRKSPRVHLVAGVHRVRDLQPGLYVLPRSGQGEALLRTQLTRWRDWAASDIAIAEMSLYHIKLANVQRALATLCCQQHIAGDSAFVLGFLAEFDAALQRPESYCELLQEAGALAHATYLRATALGFAGTGIGCFFDDAWHELLGIDNTSLQFLYHFAAGVPLRDTRLQQLPGYFHLSQRRLS